MFGLEPYLNFNGNCGEAMRFYERVLDGKMEMFMTFGESPMGHDCGPADANRIMHACLEIQGKRLMASDTMPGQPYNGMQGFGIALSYDSIEDAKRVFNAFAEGGTVTMPMDKTFWVEQFGMVVDKFGTCWLINGGKPLITP